MHIFQIKYGRGRTVQPREYESDRVDVEFTAQLTENDDIDTVLTDLRTRALAEVGRGPGKTTETVEAKEVMTSEEETALAEQGTEAEEADKKAAEAKKSAKKTRKKKDAPAEKPAESTREAEGVVGDIQDDELVTEAGDGDFAVGFD